MTKTEKYAYWIMLSDYDLGTIDCLIEGERWIYVAYLCQQAVERQLKGMYVYYTNNEAPKTHNLNFLFSKMLNTQKFQETVDQAAFESRRNACEDFLIDVMYYYMSDYPFSYKNITNRFVGKERALELHGRTLEQIEWLRSFQPAVALPKPEPDTRAEKD